ncbi:MAG: glutathione S-transferase family protein [Gemmobacter sp.]|uniref:glutathione S-transferase family protein n=1 Tax=Gemmobacter sp. TaxID=1898957 RepID=UPI0039198DE2
MGQLVNGVWDPAWYDTAATGGRFERTVTRFRNWITPDGGPGPDGARGFKAEAGRYHLYVSYACPWAHRTLIFRTLKGLQGLIDVSVVHPDMLADGWTFATDFPGTTGDRLHGAAFLRDVYTRAVPDVSGRVTVPVLWDKATDTIVSNESAEIIRMFNSAFDHLTGNTADFWPESLRPEIDAVNDRVYHGFNNGVYRAGFATSQAAYDEAVAEVFATLDWLEDRLGREPFLVGGVVTEADWRLFTTLVRFDTVYHGHFKCNRARLVDYPNLWAYTRALWQVPGVAETVRQDHIVQHYHYSHDTINPYRIVPIGPHPDFSAPHSRPVPRF